MRHVRIIESEKNKMRNIEPTGQTNKEEVKTRCAKQTKIASKQVGDAVNIEIDSTTQTIVSTVERIIAKN